MFVLFLVFTSLFDGNVYEKNISSYKVKNNDDRMKRTPYVIYHKNKNCSSLLPSRISHYILRHRIHMNFDSLDWSLSKYKVLGRQISINSGIQMTSEWIMYLWITNHDQISSKQSDIIHSWSVFETSESKQSHDFDIQRNLQKFALLMHKSKHRLRHESEFARFS